MSTDLEARRLRQAFLLGLIGVIVFGLTMPATRAAVLELDPLFVSLGRALLAAVLAAITLLLARARPPERRDWPRLFWFALCSIIGFPLLMTVAMQYAPASHAAVVLAVLPLLTAMAGVLVARERPSVGFWACGAAGTAVVLVYALISSGSSSDLNWADLLLACAALSAATAYALGGELSHRVGGWEVISWALVASAPVLLVLFFLVGSADQLERLRLRLGRLLLRCRVQPVPRFLRLEQGHVARRHRQDRTDAAAAAVRDAGGRLPPAGRADRLDGGRLLGAGGGVGGAGLAHARHTPAMSAAPLRRAGAAVPVQDRRNEKGRRPCTEH